MPGQGSRSGSPSRRNLVQAQRYNTGLRRLQRILKRFKWQCVKNVLDKIRSNLDASLRGSGNRLRSLEADVIRVKRLELGLDILHGVLAASTKGAMFTSFRGWSSMWKEKRQLHEAQKDDRAKRALEAMHVQLDYSRQAQYHARIVRATESLVDGVTTELELQGAAMLLWELRKARMHRLDLCVKALDLMAGTLEQFKNFASKRRALHGLWNNWDHEPIVKPAAPRTTVRRVYAAETRMNWMLQDEKITAGRERPPQTEEPASMWGGWQNWSIF